MPGMGAGAICTLISAGIPEAVIVIDLSGNNARIVVRRIISSISPTQIPYACFISEISLKPDKAGAPHPRGTPRLPLLNSREPNKLTTNSQGQLTINVSENGQAGPMGGLVQNSSL